MNKAIEESNKSFEREMAKAEKDVERQMEQAEKQAEAQMALLDRQLSTGVRTPTAESQNFDFKNVTVKSDFGLTRVIGEVTNNSGRSYSIASFVVTLYDKQGKLLDTGYANVSNLTDGQSKIFGAPFTSNSYNEIDKYKIQFENGF